MEHDYKDVGVRVAPGAATELPSRRPGNTLSPKVMCRDAQMPRAQGRAGAADTLDISR
jgi:hypothetical protein